jgi:hypothetical protein
MTEEIVTQASALDNTHLELDAALPDDIGQRLEVRIRPSRSEQKNALHEERVAYQIDLASEGKMDTTLDVKQAIATANRFIVENLPDRFSAGLPKLVRFPLRQLWLVPVLLTYPDVGVIGEIGMLAVDGNRPAVVGWTPPEEMEALAHQLYEEKRDEIELAFS